MFARDLTDAAQPKLYLLPAPLRTVPTPKRMSINRRVAGDNGVMVTGLNGVSVLVDSPADMPRAFRLLDELTPDTYAASGMADPTPTIDMSTPVLPCDVPAIDVKALYCWPRDLAAGDVVIEGTTRYTVTSVIKAVSGAVHGLIGVDYADGAHGCVVTRADALTLTQIIGGPKMDAARAGKAIIERRPAAGFYVYKGLKEE